MPKHIAPLPEQALEQSFLRLVKIMQTLRADCPWDRKQTLESLIHLTIEETYELSDAILEGDLQEVKNELGDLMMHLVFYAQIGTELEAFNLNEVLNAVCDKLIHRHPHIYGDTEAQDEESVKRNWEKLKLQEGHKSVLAGVPGSLPALVKAARIQEKARGVGFDWDNKQQVWEKVEEELAEFKAEYNDKPEADVNTEKAEAEFGDVLFSLINYARFIGINPENALEKTNKKFIKRFQHIEKQAQHLGKNLQDMSLEEMDVFWNEAKKL